MGFLSKVWKGAKKLVKGAAKKVKKLAKGVVTALPGGQKLWKEGGRLGKKVLKGIGKITSALGPVGMIAMSVLAPYAAPLWNAFGAAAAGAGGIWGTIGTAIYNGANWVGGTLGSMTSGISNGLSTLAKGGFKGLGTSLGKAGSEVLKGFTKAFSGEAGQAGIQAGIKAATDSAIQQAAGKSVLDQVTDKIAGDISSGSAPQVALDEAGNKAFSSGPEAFKIQASNVPDFGTAPASEALTPTLSEKLSTATALGPQSAASVSRAIQGSNNPSLLSQASKVAKSLLAGASETPQYQAPSIGDVGGQRFAGDAFARGGIGSAGGQFLTPAQKQALQLSEQQLTRGFG